MAVSYLMTATAKQNIRVSSAVRRYQRSSSLDRPIRIGISLLLGDHPGVARTEAKPVKRNCLQRKARKIQMTGRIE